MKVPPTPAPDDPLTIADFIGDKAREWILQLQQRAARIGYTILGAQIEKEDESTPRIQILIGQFDPTATSPTPWMQSNWSFVQGPRSMARTNVTDRPYQMIASRSTDTRTIIEPRGYYAFLLDHRVKLSSESPGDLAHAAMTGRDIEITRKPVRLVTSTNRSLTEIVQQYCARAGHRLDYLGTDFRGYAHAVITPHNQGLLDILCDSTIGRWYNCQHGVSTDSGRWRLHFAAGPMLSDPTYLYMPTVLVPPTGSARQVLDDVTLVMEFERDTSAGYLMANNMPAGTYAASATASGLKFLARYQERAPDPATWLADLEATGQTGTLLARLIRYEELPFETRRTLYSELTSNPLPTLYCDPSKVKRRLRQALAEPYVATAPGTKALAKPRLLGTEFRL